MVSKVRYLTFGIFSPACVEIPPNSKLVSVFQGVRMLDIYDHKMRHVGHYYNPQLIILEEGRDIFHGVKYHFMIRYEDEETLDATTFIEIEDQGATDRISHDSVYEIVPKEYFNEEFYQKESKEFMARIVEEMEDKEYQLEKVQISELRRSFPSNMLLNEIDIELPSEGLVVIMVTNKRKIFSLEDHSLEFDSEEKSFVWNPLGDENFSFIVLDEGDDVEIAIKEYLYCDESKLLPITAMTFY